MTRKQKPRLRALTKLEVEVLDFIWKWKLANTMTLKVGLAPQKSFWKFYQMLRRLMKEGYTKEIVEKGLDVTLWVLTRKGFDYIFGSSEELTQKRYQVQSVSHDFWATAFHLGDFLYGTPKNVQLVSEQELTAKHDEVIPSWVPKAREHIPDGYTAVLSPKKMVVMAFETEISVKTAARYEEMIHFLDKNESIDMAFWLCHEESLISLITQRILKFPRLRSPIHNFILLNDFQKLGWGAPILWGSKSKMTLREVMVHSGVDTSVSTTASGGQPEPISVFCSPIKSPRGLKT